MNNDSPLYEKGVNNKIREEYKDIFSLKGPIRERPCKMLFDKVFSILAIILASPIFLLILLAYFIDGLAHPEHKGEILSPYISLSQDREFIKYKFRLHKESAIDKDARKRADLMAYPHESDMATLTCVGRFLKKHYLNELPQVFNILKGDISFVGIRPIAQRDYIVEEKSGHVRRKLLKAGIFSQTHVRKGTPDRYKDELDYDYIRKYLTLSGPALIMLDISIILRGLFMVAMGERRSR